MANKKTVVQMYEEILAIESLTAEQKEFLRKRIEITKKKNAKREDAEPTPKQKEQLAEYAAIEDEVVAVMVVGTSYTASDLVKLIDREDVSTPQRLTPRLTALATANRVVKSTIKGRSVYSLPTAEAEK